MFFIATTVEILSLVRLAKNSNFATLVMWNMKQGRSAKCTTQTPSFNIVLTVLKKNVMDEAEKLLVQNLTNMLNLKGYENQTLQLRIVTLMERINWLESIVYSEPEPLPQHNGNGVGFKCTKETKTT